MATIRKDIVQDFPDGKLIYDVDDKLGPINHRTEWKPGTPGDNKNAQQAKLTQARDYFRTNYAQWGTLTAQQKDAANRQAQRAIANLIAWVMDDMSDSGD